MRQNVKAVIDIGSNSIKLRVGRRAGNGDIEELLDNAEVVQLGKGFVNGGISEERMRKALDVVTDMVAAAHKKGAGMACPAWRRRHSRLHHGSFGAECHPGLHRRDKHETTSQPSSASPRG